MTKDEIKDNMDGNTITAAKMLVRESNARLRSGMASDIGAAKARGGRRVKVGRTGELVGQIDQHAMMRAAALEGREVLTEAGKGYWDDQARLYPHLRGRVHSGFSQSLDGKRTRWGKATQRCINGEWVKL